MATLSASVMAHPAREQFVDELLAALDRPVDVAWDTGRPSSDKQKRWWNGRAAWEMATGDWHVVIQDDAIVCRDLLAGLERALDLVPDEVGIVQPYIGTIRPMTSQFLRLTQRADETEATWVQTRSMCWGVAIAVRSESIPQMLPWCDKQRSLAYDTRVGRYYRDVLKQVTWYTWPSLVDHRPGPSLVGHGTGRTARRLHAGSALDIEWGDSAVRDGVPVRPAPNRSPNRRAPRQIVKG